MSIDFWLHNLWFHMPCFPQWVWYRRALAKNESITYYGHVPVTQYFMCEEMRSKWEEEIKHILSYISSNLEKYLVNREPYFIDFKNASDAAENFSNKLSAMIEKYDQKYN